MYAAYPQPTAVWIPPPAPKIFENKTAQDGKVNLTDEDLEHAPKKDKKSARVEKVRKKSQRELDKEAWNERYYESKKFWKNVKQFGTAQQAASLYWSTYAEFRTDPFRDSTSTNNKKASDALAEGMMGRLLDLLQIPICYSLKYHHLGLSKEDSRPEGIFDPAVLALWREAIAKLIPKPYYYRFEVGYDNQLHVHLIAESNPKLRYSRKVAQPLYEAKGAVAYLYKPILPWSESNLALRLEAERNKTTKQFPRTSGFSGVPYKKGALNETKTIYQATIHKRIRQSARRPTGYL